MFFPKCLQSISLFLGISEEAFSGVFIAENARRCAQGKCSSPNRDSSYKLYTGSGPTGCSYLLTLRLSNCTLDQSLPKPPIPEECAVS